MVGGSERNELRYFELINTGFDVETWASTYLSPRNSMTGLWKCQKMTSSMVYPAFWSCSNARLSMDVCHCFLVEGLCSHDEKNSS